MTVRTLGSLVALLVVAACGFDRRSTEFACETMEDCTGGRVCDRGFCVEPGGGGPDGSIIDASPGPDGDPAIDAADPPDAAPCPPECDLCLAGTCQIDCDTPAACATAVTCPAGMPVHLGRSGAGSRAHVMFGNDVVITSNEARSAALGNGGGISLHGNSDLRMAGARNEVSDNLADRHAGARDHGGGRGNGGPAGTRPGRRGRGPCPRIPRPRRPCPGCR